MKIFNKLSAAALVFALAFSLSGVASAATKVNFGAADGFAVLSGVTITNTGYSVISNGDMGMSPGNSVTGFPPGVVNGAQHIADSTSVQAKNDLTAAYLASEQTPSTVASELGGTTKMPGTYDSINGSFGITGTLTLDAQGDPNAVFIFRTASTLTTSGASIVNLINSAQACNVFWQVGSSATLGINSNFSGNIMALQSVTLTTGANVLGRVFARNGAVTLDTNSITRAACSGAVVMPVAATTTVTTVTSSAVVTPVVTTTTTFVNPPALPNTGIGPDDSGFSARNIVIPAVALLALFSLYLARRKRLV